MKIRFECTNFEFMNLLRYFKFEFEITLEKNDYDVLALDNFFDIL